MNDDLINALWSNASVPKGGSTTGRAVLRNGRLELPEEASSKIGSGNQNFLTSLISEAGGTGGAIKGAAAGSAFGPIGTLLGGVAGGFGGAFLGRLAENKVRDDEYRVGDALEEGAISGILGAGPLKLGKAALTGAGAKLTGKAVKPAVENALETTLLGKLAGKTGAKQADMVASGLNVGTPLGGGKVLEPDYADELYRFARQDAQKYVKGGIKTGKPITQARSAQEAKNNIGKALTARLDEINAPLLPGEGTNLVEKAIALADESAEVSSITTGFRKLVKKIENAKDLKALEAVRKEADDLGYKVTGAGGPKETSAAAQARIIRDVIDEYVTGFDDTYKAIKGDWQKARDLVKLSSTKSASSDKSMRASQNILGALSQGQTGQGIKSKIGGVGASGQPSNVGILSRIATGSTLDNQPMPEEEALIDTETGEALDGQILDAAPAGLDQAQANTPFSSDNIQAMILQDLQQTGGKNVSMLTSLYKTFGETAGQKPLSSEASKVVSNAELGLTAIDDYEQLIAQDPEAFGRTGLPVVGVLDNLTQGRVSGALGTDSIDAAADQIIDVLARLRTGAAISRQEETRFQRYIPRPGDSDATVQQKLGYLRQAFRGVFERAQGSTELDPSEALSPVLAE